MTPFPPDRSGLAFRNCVLALALVAPALAQRPQASAAGLATSEGEMRASSAPLFVPNRGGWNPAVEFAVVHGPHPAWIERNGFRLLGRPGAHADEVSTVLQFAFEGGDAERVVGVGEPVAAVHRWVAGAQGGGDAFAAVRFESVWPGIDVVVRADHEAGAAGALAYDLHVAPGADLSRAVLRVSGAERLSLLDDGRLEVLGASASGSDAPALKLLQRAPVSWCTDDDGVRTPVEVRFRALGGDRFGFVSAPRPDAQELVVDPGFTWIGYLGRASSDRIEAVAVREDGIWVTGYTGSTAYPTTPGAWRENGRRDAFVSRLSVDGRNLVWSTFFGGSQPDVGKAIDVAPDGSVWFGGQTSSTDLPITANAFQPNFGGYGGLLVIGDAFVARLSADGSALPYCTYVGGGGDDFVEMVKADGRGGVVFAGYCDSDDLPTTPGSAQPVFGSASLLVPDAFVGRLTDDGATLDWLTYFGGAAMEYLTDAELGPDGSVWICGWSGSLDFPATPGAFQTDVRGLWDAYLARIAPDGASVLAASLFGGDGPDQARGLAVDPWSGDCFLVGTVLTNISSLPVGRGGWQRDRFGDTEGFVVRVDRDAASIRAGTLFGGALADNPLDATVLADGGLVVVGTTEGGALPVGDLAPQPAFGGGVNDGFIARFDPWLLQSPNRTYLGGPEKELLVAVEPLPGTSDVIVVGQTESDGLAVGRPLQPRAFGGLEGLLARVDVSGVSSGAVEVALRGAPGADGVAFQPGESVALALEIRNATGSELELSSLELRFATQGELVGTLRTCSVVEDTDGDGVAGGGEPFLAGPLPVDRSALPLDFGGRSLEDGAVLNLVVTVATDPLCPPGRELFVALNDPTSLSLRSADDGRTATVVFRELAAPTTGALAGSVFVAGERATLELDQDQDGAVTVLDVRRLAERQGEVASVVEDLDGDGTVTSLEVDAAVDRVLGRPAVALDARAVRVGGLLELRGVALDEGMQVTLGGRPLKALGGGGRLRAFVVPRDMVPGRYAVVLGREGGTPRALGEIEVQ